MGDGDMDVVITRDIAFRAACFGACSAPKPGTFLSDISFSDLIWAHWKNLIDPHELPEELSKAPLWALASYGYGYGDGNGYGNGYGDGAALLLTE